MRVSYRAKSVFCVLLGLACPDGSSSIKAQNSRRGEGIAIALPGRTESSKPYSSIVSRARVYQSPNCGSMLSLKDGRILWAWGVGGNHKPPFAMQANFSSDGGRTWSDPESLKQTDGSNLVSFLSPSLARMKSGKIGMVQTQSQVNFNADSSQITATFHVSKDEGKSWSKGVQINSVQRNESPYFDQLSILRDGRPQQEVKCE